jgi:4-amino-4-deoxy-L-arabinose transferase-like glycosyltransferase
MTISRSHLAVYASVSLTALAWFAAGVQRSGIASQYCDPVSRIGAQDDAVYGREAIEMATGGTWLTPTYLGRYALNKPPMLQWLTAASLRLFGISAWSLRVPSLVSAAIAVALLFAFVWRGQSLLAAACAVVLLASSHLFYVFSRLTMTDMMICLWMTAAMVTLARDPTIGRSATLWSFGVLTGAAVLTKGIAGVLPILALIIYYALSPRDARPRPARMLAAAGIAVLVAMPWHLYQLAVHPRWFTVEYILQQHLAVGVMAPQQYSDENHLMFYAKRVFAMDPVLTLLAVAGLLLALRDWRRNRVTLAWAAAIIVGLFLFRYRSNYYLLPLLPALAALATRAVSVLPRRGPALTLAALMVVAGVKVASPSSVWGIPAAVETRLPVAGALDSYCRQHRGNGLILVAVGDEFYSSTLPLPSVRYCLLTAPPAPGSKRPYMDFELLGISVSVSEFELIDAWLPTFRAWLTEYNLRSVAPVATVIRATSPQDVERLISTQPGSDFFLPDWLFRQLTLAGPHRVVHAPGAHVFLLSPKVSTYRPTRACGL